MKALLNDLCYLLLYTSVGRCFLGFLCDIAWIYGYIKGKVRKFCRRLVK